MVYYGKVKSGMAYCLTHVVALLYPLHLPGETGTERGASAQTCCRDTKMTGVRS